MLVCLAFIFCSLVELAIVGYMCNAKENGSPPASPPTRSRRRPACFVGGGGDDDSLPNSALLQMEQRRPSGGAFAFCKRRRRRRPSVQRTEPWLTVEKVDKFSCYAAPLMFFLFNVLYWAYYLPKDY